MTKNNTGFTLIETVLVMAIMGLLFVIIFTGSQQLQDRARFDTSVDAIIQDVAYARNYSNSNINESTIAAGNSTQGVQAGAAFELDGAHIAKNLPLVEVEPIFAPFNANGDADITQLDDSWPPGGGINTCPASQHPDDPDECVEDFLHLPDTDLVLSSVNGITTNRIAIYFVKTVTGLQVCHDLAQPIWLSVKAACATFGGPALDMVVKDNEGFSATIEVDTTTGAAKRL